MSDSARGEPGTWRFLAYWDNGAIDLGATRAELPVSDRDASGVIRNTVMPQQLHHVPGDRRWYVWSGTHQKPDKSALAAKLLMTFSACYDEVIRTARAAVQTQVALDHPGDPKALDAAFKKEWESWKACEAYANAIRNTRGMSGLETMLAKRCGTSPEEMADRYPGHWCCDAGIVDLLAAGGTAADLYPHDPAAMMIYCSPVTYEQGSAADPEHTLAPAYRCPQFAAMVLRACGGDQTVATYLIMALGYALLGYNPHQLCFFLTGPTGNGKSKILSIVSTVMGPALAYEAETPLLARVKDRHPRHAATMRGKRLITMSETNQALYLDEMQLKRLTGEDYISVELLYEQTMTRTQVSWVIFIGNNMMPSLLHLDAALRRRIVVIPMSGVSVPEWERDEGLAARIVAEEAAGIAALLVWGCRAAMAKPGGLTDLPVAVAAATAQYAAEQNIAARWVSERCVLRTDGPAVAGADCYRSMRQWCRPEEDPGRNSFYEMLAEVPGVRRVPGDGEHAVWFTGCEIKRDWL